MNKIAFNIGEKFFGTGGFRQATDVGRLVSATVMNAMIFAGVVLIFMIIISGYSMISASGDPGKMQQAQKILTAAIIGFILVAASLLIVYILETSTGTTLL